MYTSKNNKLFVKYCGIINIGDKHEDIMSFYTVITRKWTLCFYGTNETFLWNWGGSIFDKVNEEKAKGEQIYILFNAPSSLQEGN